MTHEQIRTALSDIGYDLANISGDSIAYVSVSTDSADKSLAEIRSALPGMLCEFTGNGDGDETDIAIDA